MNKIPTIFSLDVSTVSTGWCLTKGKKTLSYGVIKINKNVSFSMRLCEFRIRLKELLNSFNTIDYIVIENGFALRNVKTLKALSRFSGVAMECCVSVTGKEPFIMNNKTVKKFFNVKTKEELYGVITKKYRKLCKDFEFNTHNDVTDAIAQAVCYYEEVLKQN